jgi:hypothetical protein
LFRDAIHSIAIVTEHTSQPSPEVTRRALLLALFDAALMAGHEAVISARRDPLAASVLRLWAEANALTVRESWHSVGVHHESLILHVNHPLDSLATCVTVVGCEQRETVTK